MKCEVCGLELAVREWREQEGILLLVCRNGQCPRYGQDLKFKSEDMTVYERAAR